MKKLKICKNEFDVYYIADADGIVQYKDGVLLACCNKDVMRMILKKLKQKESLKKNKIAIQTINDENALKNKKVGLGYEIFDKEFKAILQADFVLDKDVKEVAFSKVKKELIEKNLFLQEINIRGLKYFFTWGYCKNNVIVNYYNERQA